MQTPASKSKLGLLLVGVLVFILGGFALDGSVSRILARQMTYPDWLLNFSTVFLGIFIEAAPFLLMGSLASGAVAVFVSERELAMILPKNKILATAVGALIGFLFPVCECGVVPLVRRLYQKGMPLSACVAFLLGAPVLNPVVIASTYVAFGNSTVFWARLGFTFLIAFGIGLVFITQNENALADRWRWMLSDTSAIRASLKRGLIVEGLPSYEPFGTRLQRAITIATDDFIDTGRYLVVGTLIATALQTFVPQQTLLSFGSTPLTSNITLIVLAYLISVCSTVDSFLALSLINTFSVGSIVAFLVFGPMVDIKSTLMFLSLFRRKVVVYLIILIALASMAAGLLLS